MKVYATESIRNIGFFSHSGAGKTSICDAFLFATGKTGRLHSVDDENSTFDTDPEEHHRRTTVSMHLGHVEWRKHKINFIDTPGDLNFQADVRFATTAIDVGFVLVPATDGVEVGTEKVFEALTQAKIPKIAVVSKMDREHANFDKVVADLHTSFGVRPTVLFLPIGGAESFRGIVDVVRKQAYHFPEAGKPDFSLIDIPAEIADRVEELHGALVENVAESDEALMEKYFEGELTGDDVIGGLRSAIVKGEILPVLCASGRTLAGIPQMLDFMVDLVPSPPQCLPVPATAKGGEEIEVSADPEGDLAVFVFKTFVDPFAGKLTCIRVRRGVFPGAGDFFNATLSTRERYSQLLVLQGKEQENVAQANAGDIVVLAKLKETQTGNTICNEKAQIAFASPPLPPKAISFAIKPRSQTDEEKLGPSIHRIMEEDACITFDRDEVTGDFLLSGLGQVHIESIVARLKSRFKVEVDLDAPKVPYRETIRKAGDGRGRHKKQTGGRGQFGSCFVKLEPAPRGSGYEYVDKIVGGAIPRQFIPAVDKGLRAAMKRGILAGFPVVDVRATCYDGSFHAVDSSDMAFQIAGSLAFKEIAPRCDPVILEPVMKLEIVVPDEYMGDVIGDLNSRRGRVLGMDPRGKNQVILAMAPMAEVLRYATDLKSITSARGSFTMEFDHFAEIPPDVQEKIVAAASKAGDD